MKPFLLIGETDYEGEQWIRTFESEKDANEYARPIEGDCMGSPRTYYMIEDQRFNSFNVVDLRQWMNCTTGNPCE